ncbi:Hypothetical protein PHPALM_37941, partial [Phytophthora palmivora]
VAHLAGMEPLNILGRFSLSLSFRLKLLDLLLHSRHLFFPARVDFGSPTRTLRIRFGFALLPTLSVIGIQALALETYSLHDTLGRTLSFVIREFLDLATRVQVTLFPESLSLQGIQAFSGEKLSLLLLHFGRILSLALFHILHTPFRISPGNFCTK